MIWLRWMRWNCAGFREHCWMMLLSSEGPPAATIPPASASLACRTSWLPDALRSALDEVVCDWDRLTRATHTRAAREHALATREAFGVWGGLSEDERDEMLAARTELAG